MENEIIKRFEEKFVSLIPSKKKAFWCEEPIVNEIKKFILSELKDLKEECVGEERNCSLCGRKIPHKGYTLNYCQCVGSNHKRKEIIKAFAKRGI